MIPADQPILVNMPTNATNNILKVLTGYIYETFSRPLS